MIHIFFVPGMFGSMIEMVLRAFTELDGSLEPKLCDDGSAHTFLRQYHPESLLQIGQLPEDVDITTLSYPTADAKLLEILQHVENVMVTWKTDKKILIHCPDLTWAEINLLFQYYKISKGLGYGLDIFGGNVNSKDLRNWNQTYNHWQDMRPWQYREWFSLFYPTWVEEWIQSKNQVSDDFLVLTNQQLLESTKECLLNIIEFCDLHLVKSLDQFAEHYQRQQNYVIQEYEIIRKIPHSVIDREEFNWTQLSPIGECILQHRFREAGYEWYCEELDILPTNSVDFSTIIHKNTGELRA